MNKVFASAVLTAALLASQAIADTITMNDGRIVEKATVSKVGVREIEYTVNKRKVIYTVRKSDVAKIIYKDGSVDLFPIQEKRRGEGFRGPRWGKKPWPGMGPGGERGEFKGGPGGFRGREEIGDYPERDAPIPPSPQGHAITPPPPPPPQGQAVTPPPPPPPAPQGHAVTPPPPPPPPAQAPAQPAATQPAKTQPAKTLPAPAPAQSTPAQQPAKTEQAR
jgi:hypothetical protein